MAEADRRRDVERALAAVRAMHGRIAPRRAVDELPDRKIHLYGLARVRKVARVLDGLEPPPGELRERGLILARERDRQTGERAHRKRLAVCFERPRDGVLGLLRRVRLREHL